MRRASYSVSISLPVSSERTAASRDAIGRAVGAGFGHVVRGLSDSYPVGVVRWVGDELIGTAAMAG